MVLCSCHSLAFCLEIKKKTMDNHKHAYKPQRTTNYVSLVLLSINVKFPKSRYILTVHESRCCQQWAEWSRIRWKNLPKSLFAIISSWVSSRPRFVAERNCQLNISPNWGQVAAGVLAKNITSWEKQTYVHDMYTINLVWPVIVLQGNLNAKAQHVCQ